ncbi:Glutamate decarboxylase 2 [Linderina pennispora]|nr:Glutamate decarboxylase 2 [Linderina pennispora]
MPPVQHAEKASSTVTKGPLPLSSLPSLSPESQAEELRALMSEAANVFAGYVDEAARDSSDVIKNASPQQLLAALDLRLPESGVGRDGIWNDIHSICDSAANTWNKGFLFKLFASPTPIGVVGEGLTALLNNNSHVYESSPTATVLEATLGSKLAEMANFPTDTAAGLTFPGGSYSNMHALMTARNQRFCELKTGGFAALAGVRPVVFTSHHGHYSIDKAAVAAGIGLDNVIKVPTDASGRMDPQALRHLVVQSIAAGATPFFVNATAGTTVLGAFDPVAEIADICEEFSMWLHVDGSWGAPLVLFGDREATGFEFPAGKINSLTVNPHKLMGVPLQCSFLIMRDGLGTMKESLGLNASYLFHQQTHADDMLSVDSDPASAACARLGGSWDVGDATMGCGRRPDAIKLWVSWRYYGTKYFHDRVVRARQLALDLASMVESRQSAEGQWRLFTRPQSNCVCFWFVPRGIGEEDLGEVTKAICHHINKAGKILIDYATVDLYKPLPGQAIGERYQIPTFFRIPLNNPAVDTSTLEQILSIIEGASVELYHQ